MLSKLLPILLLLIGTGAGVGAGVFLRPEPTVEEPKITAETQEGETVDPSGQESEEPLDREYVKLSNQFVIPVVADARVSALVVMSLSVEVKPGHRDEIFAKEPKLRDSFLQVMFDHANIGGFRGTFTETGNLDILRVGLREIAIRDVGEIVTDVLILDIARQDY